jgi:hypothetical protein
MYTIFFQNIAEIKADVLVIPHSTTGTMMESIEEIVRGVNLMDQVPKNAELGDIHYVPVDNPKSITKYIAFACSVQELRSSYVALRQIGHSLFYNLPNSNITKIACPLLGTGGGGLPPDDAYAVLVKSMVESNELEIDVDFYTIDERNIVAAFAPDPNLTSAQEVFRLITKDIHESIWVKEMIEADEFYFQLAQDKYYEFLAFSFESEDTFLDLFREFSSGRQVFSAFINNYEETTPKYEFLKICGELIAYIDRNGYNKQEWNKNFDKRTMALSSVNQTRWIENLLRFRSSGNSLMAVSKSIGNALVYLGDPANHLTMLSQSHRDQVAEVLFYDAAEDDLMRSIFKFFMDIGLECIQSKNNGALYSRILYVPDVKSLWNYKDRDKIIGAPLINKTERTTEPISEETIEGAVPESIRMRNLSALMHSDIYAKKDLLNYETYASVIARLLTSGLNPPPFNVSIIAPWGKGKTSMMHFIADKIKEQTTVIPEIKERPISSYQQIMKWLKKPAEVMTGVTQLQHPVVWFNAWKFQKSEEVWAGLADEIINQLAESLKGVNREKFWLKLNLKRLDIDKLKRELLFKFLAKCIWPFTYMVLGALCSWVINYFTSKVQNIDWIRYIEAVPIILATYLAYKKTSNEWNKPPELDLGKYVLQPEYRQKMGYLTAVVDDLKQAIKLLVEPDKPAVIFIDDLDRCSPKVITELIEAINSFMSGDMSNCYFIIGQDAQLVTAALDVAYDAVGSKVGNIDKHHSSIGWFFMEKFSQLSFNIPVMTHLQTEKLLKALLDVLDLEKIPDATKQAGLLEEYALLEKELDTLDQLELIFSEKKTRLEDEIILFNRDRVMGFQEKILSKAFQNYQIDDNELENLIIYVAPYLDNSPRTIKRFVNLFLFYRFLRFTEISKDLQKVSPQILGKWLLLMVRWPQLIQAIQWDSEKGFVKGSTPEERAENFDQLLYKAKDHKDWIRLWTKEINGDMTWIADPHLFLICKGDKENGVNLKDALVAGIW